MKIFEGAVVLTNHIEESENMPMAMLGQQAIALHKSLSTHYSDLCSRGNFTSLQTGKVGLLLQE